MFHHMMHDTAFTLCGTAACANVMTYFMQIKKRKTAPSICQMHLSVKPFPDQQYCTVFLERMYVA